MKKQNKQIRSVRRLAYTTRAFTLVELIVVITILAILGTIAFISLQGYSSQARDSKRLSDIQNIKKSLELFSLNTGKYPKPDDYFTVSYGSQDLRYQGTVGEQVAVNLSRNLNEKTTDPLTENEYTYSRTYAGNEYEILSIYESDLVSQNNNLLNQTNAANANYPKINGNYNGVYVKAGTYYIPTPSIINSLNTDLDLEVQTDGLLSQIITGGDNNIANAGIEASTGGLTGMSVEIFTGILDTDIGEDDNNNKEELAQAFIDAYNGTILASDGVYKEIVETSSEDFVNLVDTFVLNNNNFTNTTNGNNGGGDTTPNPYASCIAQGEKLSAITTYPGCDTADIIICSGVGAGYTISACNVGATIASTDWTVSGGEYFQWGRNKGFAYGDTTQYSTPILNANYDPNNDTYGFVWDTFLGYDWIEDRDLNLWGDITDTNEARQGPCAIGYHVPLHTEWSGVVSAGDGYLWDILGTITEATDFKTELKLPAAGYRYRRDGDFDNSSTYGYYWASSSNHDSVYAYYLHIHPSYIWPIKDGCRSNGYSVRCFKN